VRSVLSLFLSSTAASASFFSSYLPTGSVLLIFLILINVTKEHERLPQLAIFMKGRQPSADHMTMPQSELGDAIDRDDRVEKILFFPRDIKPKEQRLVLRSGLEGRQRERFHRKKGRWTGRNQCEQSCRYDVDTRCHSQTSATGRYRSTTLH
jgi:hypothetical protein